MVPWGGILRFLTVTVVPFLAKRLIDPNLVNKMSNSTLMRRVARLAVRMKIKYEEETEEIKNQFKEKDQSTSTKTEDSGQQKRTSIRSTRERNTRVKDREYYRESAEKLKRRKR